VCNATWAQSAAPIFTLVTLFFHFLSGSCWLQSRSKLYSWKALRAVSRTNLQAFAAVSAACWLAGALLLACSAACFPAGLACGYAKGDLSDR
jgi:hypothetical protein